MKDINLKYKKKLWEIYREPDFICKPRGLKITEKLNNSWIIDMDDPIITIPERNYLIALCLASSMDVRSRMMLKV